MMRPNVGVICGPEEWPLPGLEPARELADVRLVKAPEDLVDTEVLFVWDFRTTLFSGRRPFKALRWVQAGSVGVDTIVNADLAGSDIVVTNTRGVFERPIAEYVLGMLLAFAKDLPQTLALQRRGTWQHRETEMLRGKQALILGAGAIAGEVAMLMGAVGITVTAVGRTARDGVPGLGNVHSISEIDELLAETDVVVVALPLTHATRGFLDAERLDHLRRGAWLVNVGRGALIDENALLDGLRSGRIGRAGLDVFEHEPLPPDHPFWTMEQVIVSPHMCADTVGWCEAVVAEFVKNLRRWCDGKPLLHVVDKQSLRA